MADLHLGGWREDTLREIGIKSFEKAIDISIEEKVDFILISGDLFDSSNPTIDVMASAARKLYQLKEKNIEVYVIEGSHDFSPTGRTILKVFQEAGLLKKVTSVDDVDGKLRLRGIKDSKTGISIYGVSGIRGSLEKATYDVLDRANLEESEGNKIFMFHSAIQEFKPSSLAHMEAIPISYLPKSFLYYAGGHIHDNGEFELDGYKNVVFPGALFPNNIDELLIFRGGGFYIVSYENDKITKKYVPIKIYPVIILEIPIDRMTSFSIEEKIKEITLNKDFTDSIVITKFKGKLEGNISSINFKKINEYLEKKGARLVKRDTRELILKEYKEVKNISFTKEKLEEDIISRHKDQIAIKGCATDTIPFVKNFMELLSREKKEGEKKDDYYTNILRDSLEYLRKLKLLGGLDEDNLS
jgi:DNA repair exonuclease SbcCD nuclease subunit